MSGQILTQTISCKAASNYASNQYYLVYISSDNTITLASAASTEVFVLQDNPASGYYGSIAISGTTKVKLGGTVSAGARVMATTDGSAITKSGASFSPGILLQGGVIGDVVEMLIAPCYFAA